MTVLSFLQENLWTMQQKKPTAGQYNLPLYIELSGNFILKLFEKTISIIMEHQACLRTSFITVNDAPLAFIHSSLKPPIKWHDLTSILDPITQEQTLLKLVHKLSMRSFDLRDAPLFTIDIIKLQNELHGICFVLHHSISDGWAIVILLKQINKIYMALKLGEPIKLPPLLTQYHEFALEQRQNWNLDSATNHIQYWQKQLNHWQFLQLPVSDIKHTKSSSKDTEHYEIKLGETYLQKINTLAKHAHVSKFVVHYTIIQILLHKLTKQTDLILGVAFFNRKRSTLKKIIGYLSEPLPIRCQFSKEQSIHQLLQLVNKTLHDADLHTHKEGLAACKVLEAAGFGDHPLFHMVVDYFGKNPFSFNLLGDLNVKKKLIATLNSRMDLSWFWIMYEQDKSLHLNIAYDPNLFTVEIMKHVATLYEQLILEITHDKLDHSLFEICNKLPTLHSAQEENNKVTICATFTIDPLISMLEFLKNKLTLSYHLNISPSRQLFQQLLYPSSSLSRKNKDMNIFLFRLEDLQENFNRWPALTNEFITAFKTFALSSQAINLILFCPSSIEEYTESKNILYNLQSRIVNELSQLKNLYFSSASEMMRHYPLYDYIDHEAQKIASIPYRDNMFAALALWITRKYSLLYRYPYKVILLDSLDVFSTNEFEFVKQFFIQQAENNKLIYFCEPNGSTAKLNKLNPMLLKHEHVQQSSTLVILPATEINILAANFNIEIKSFIYLSRNTEACQRMQDQHPDMLCLNFPNYSDELKNFLCHYWAFDVVEQYPEHQKLTVFSNFESSHLSITEVR